MKKPSIAALIRSIPVPPPARSDAWAVDWRPKPKHAEEAKRAGRDVEAEARNFVYVAIALAQPIVDPDADFTAWLRGRARRSDPRRQAVPRSQVGEEAPPDRQKLRAAAIGGRRVSPRGAPRQGRS